VLAIGELVQAPCVASARSDHLAIVLEHLRRNGRVEPGAPAGDSPNRSDQVLGGPVLENESRCASVDRAP
jgi:hypothetical protein